SVGMGTWTSNNLTAIFADVNDSKTSVCVDGFGISQFYWREDNGICFDIDTIAINFFDTPLISAGNDTNVCGYSVDLKGSTPGPKGTGTWTARDASGTPVNVNYTVDANDRDAKADLTLLGYGCYTFYWTIDYKFCSVVDSVDICFFDQPVSYAGLDQTICTISGKTSATPSSGTGVWTSDCAYITFSSSTNPITDVFNNQEFGCCNLIWTETNGVCIDSDTVEFCFYQQPIANAGLNFDTCGFDANLIASPSIGNGLWSSNYPGITFTPNSTPISNANASLEGYGTYDLYWTETNMNCTDVDTITVGFYQQPISNAGVNDTICGLSYTLNAFPSAGSGKWTGNGVFSNDTSATSAVSVSTYGMHIFTWTETNGPCTDNATVSIWFFQQPMANAGTTANFCALNGNLSATASVGNGEWTGPIGATFGTPFMANTTVNIAALGYGTYTFYWTEANDICVDTDAVIINFYEQPVANAGTNDTICGLSTNMNGSANVGLGTWTSTDPQVIFSNVNDSISGVIVPNYGCYTFIWTLVNGTCTDQDQVTLCFYQVPTPNAGPDDRFCGDFYTFKAQPALGFGSWSGPSGAIYSDVTNENSTIDISSVGLGIYEFYWKDSNVICVTIDTVELMFLPAPVVNCNCNNDTIYSDDPIFYFSDYSSRASQWDWNFGDGTGSNQRNPSHTYTELGTFDVSLRIWDQFGCDSIHYCKITVENNLRVFIANAFTPDGDNINETFGPKVRGHFPDTYNFKIYDRWGKLVFESSFPGREWDGTIMDSKITSQQGVYSYRLTYTDYTGQEHLRKGSITLIR
ncbi:MAG: gliding motility-associated-like protein, partial [Flavobacteriales bacterium]